MVFMGDMVFTMICWFIADYCLTIMPYDETVCYLIFRLWLRPSMSLIDLIYTYDNYCVNVSDHDVLYNDAYSRVK